VQDGRVLFDHVPHHPAPRLEERVSSEVVLGLKQGLRVDGHPVQGYLAHKKQRPLQGSCPGVIDSGLVGSTDFHLSRRGVPREKKILKEHLPRVIHHQVY